MVERTKEEETRFSLPLWEEVRGREKRSGNLGMTEKALHAFG
jgi:hypothetical protein